MPLKDERVRLRHMIQAGTKAVVWAILSVDLPKLLPMLQHLLDEP